MVHGVHSCGSFSNRQCSTVNQVVFFFIIISSNVFFYIYNDSYKLDNIKYSFRNFTSIGRIDTTVIKNRVEQLTINFYQYIFTYLGKL